MSVFQKIQKIASPIIIENGAYLVDLGMRGENGRKIIEVYIDTDKGITTDECAAVSRKISRVVDDHVVIHGRYHLVVSSPGLDRPLKLARQYPKNTGRTLSVKVRHDNQAENLEGELIDADSNGIALRLSVDEVRRIVYDAIIEARVNAAW